MRIPEFDISSKELEAIHKFYVGNLNERFLEQLHTYDTALIQKSDSDYRVTMTINYHDWFCGNNNFINALAYKKCEDTYFLTSEGMKRLLEEIPCSAIAIDKYLRGIREKTPTVYIGINSGEDYIVILPSSNVNLDTFYYKFQYDDDFIDVKHLIQIQGWANSSTPWDSNKDEPISNNEKENKSMMNMNFDFGPVTDSVRMSPYGIAVTKNGREWFTYDNINGKTIEVTGFTFDFKNMLYKMPAAITDVKVGDVVLHKGQPMFVTGIVGTQLEVIDILESEAKVVLPVTNIFGFNYITRITSIFNFNTGTPDPNNPFGNIMPMMVMGSLFGDEKNGRDGDNNFFDGDFMKMMAFSSICGGQNPFASMFNFNLTPQDKKEGK